MMQRQFDNQRGDEVDHRESKHPLGLRQRFLCNAPAACNLRKNIKKKRKSDDENQKGREKKNEKGGK